MSVVSLNERRKYPRISDAIALSLNAENSDKLDPTPTHVVRMSCGGLRFVHNKPIDPQVIIKLSMHLPSSDQTIHLASRVVSTGEEKSGVFSATTTTKYYVQVEFLEVDQATHQLLADHIHDVLNKTGLTHRLATAS